MSTTSTTAKMKSKRTHTLQSTLSQYKLDKQLSNDKTESPTNTKSIIVIIFFMISIVLI